MPKKPIYYTNREFDTIKQSLINYAKRYYANTFQDFNEASFGAMMVDLVSYLGDQLSFYTDYQANESFLDTAIELPNVQRIAKQMGFKQPGAATSTGICNFYILIPASSTSGGPDTSYIPILKLCHKLCYEFLPPLPVFATSCIHSTKQKQKGEWE